MKTQREFFAALAKCRKGWRVEGDGSIRRGRYRGGYCPITAVARDLTGERWSISLPGTAAKSIGLPESLAKRIVAAADQHRARFAAGLVLVEDQAAMLARRHP